MLNMKACVCVFFTGFGLLALHSTGTTTTTNRRMIQVFWLVTLAGDSLKDIIGFNEAKLHYCDFILKGINRPLQKVSVEI